MGIDPKNSLAGKDEVPEKSLGNGTTGSSSALGKEKKKKDDKNADELSEEDQQLKEALELLVERVQDQEAGIQQLALEKMRQEIRTATSSMTSVPKPLKFLRPHYNTLKSAYDTVASENKAYLADVISVLGMTMSAEGARESLKYRLLGSEGDIGSWGHEYVRNLAGEIGQEFDIRTEKELPVDDLMNLVFQIVPFHVKHNAEPEAVDLLLEVGNLHRLVEYIEAPNYRRTCLYLTNCASYLTDPPPSVVLEVAYQIYAKVEDNVNAVRIALKMNSTERVEDTFERAKGLEKKQLAYILARHGFTMDIEAHPSLGGVDEEESEEIIAIVGNNWLSEGFLTLARDLDVMEPKSPEDIFKESSRSSLDSARINLASSFVNGFVNAGFGQDKLMTVSVDQSSNEHWLYRNKDEAKTSTAASLGLVVLWDVDGGLPQIDKYLYSQDPNTVAGALLAVGVVNCGVRNECDPAYALLNEWVDREDPRVRVGALLGMGLAYAGSGKEQVLETVAVVLADSEQPLEVAAFAALCLGLTFVGSCHEDCLQTIVTAAMDRQQEMRQKGAPQRLFALALALLVMGTEDMAEASLEVAKTLPSEISQYCQVTMESFAYAGTGNVLKFQRFLGICGEHPVKGKEKEKEMEKEKEKEKEMEKEKGKEKEKENEGTQEAPPVTAGSPSLPPPKAAEAPASETPSSEQGPDPEEESSPAGEEAQGAAVLGLALVAGAEELGQEMALRSLSHVLQYGEEGVRRAVPLALALLCLSSPKIAVMDTLSRLTHDADYEVAKGGILALGLMGAGTNNARIAGLLRNLASYYSKKLDMLFFVRLAQGLTHLGKGLMTLNPYHSDRLLLNKSAMAGLAVYLHCCLDLDNFLLGKYHFCQYLIVPAIQPRMLITVDEELKPLPVTVRVGQAVDVVGQAGRPKTITGFQTHTTPVLLSGGDRAELATDKYIPLSPILEGFVILKKNPEYVEDHLGS